MEARDLRNRLLDYLRPAYPNIEVEVRPWDADPDRFAVYFAESLFSALYPAQRYHYLSQLIPSDFFDQHLQNTIWFELAPGETVEDLRYPDDDLIESIAPDVMRVLHHSGAIGLLDNLFCPSTPNDKRAQCFGDYRHARKVFLSCGFTEDELFDVFHVLMTKGGFCDCEILYNAVESSKLKAEYWQARANGQPAYDPHAG